MKGELFINDKDAYTTWGMSLTTTSLSTLMTPAPNKELIENKSRLEHGKRVITSNPKVDERTITLQLQFTAKDKDTFISRYLSFCSELEKGILNIRTKYMPTVVYKTIYLGCQSFSEFMQGIGTLNLKLCEPNPMDRSIK